MISDENIELMTDNLVLFWKPSRLPGGKIYFKGKPWGSKVSKQIQIRKEQYQEMKKKVPRTLQRKEVQK